MWVNKNAAVSLGRVFEDLTSYLTDNVQAWSMAADGIYHRVKGTPHLCAQSRFLSQFDTRVALTESQLAQD